MNRAPHALRATCALLILLATGRAGADALPLWEVGGARGTVSILGSIHFLRPGRDALPAPVLAAYEAADVVVMEIDLDDLDPVATQATVRRLAVDPRGRTLDILLGQPAYADATKRAAALGVDLSALRGFEPWMAALTITQVQLQKMGFDSESGVEQQLLRLARRDGKEVRGLETLEEQLEAMDSLPPATQRAFLLQTLDEAATMEAQVGDIVSAWKAGDTATLEREFLAGLEDQPELYRRIVVERNRNWVARVRALAADGKDYLVVVGTLHLVGPDSLIAMLGTAGLAPRQARAGDVVAVR